MLFTQEFIIISYNWYEFFNFALHNECDLVVFEISGRNYYQNYYSKDVVINGTLNSLSHCTPTQCPIYFANKNFVFVRQRVRSA